MTTGTTQPMNDDWFESEIRRFLVGETAHIDGAPSRSEMVERLVQAVGLTPARRFGFVTERTLRVIAVLAILAALLAGVIGAGSYWAERKPVLLIPISPDTPLLRDVGPIPLGAYSWSASTSRPFTLAVPAGWRQDDSNIIHKGDPWSGIGGVALSTWVVSHVYGDACHWRGTLREAGTPELLATALVQQLGVPTPIRRSQVTLGGLPAIKLEMAIPSNWQGAACDTPDLRIWPPPARRASRDTLWLFGGVTANLYLIDGGGQTTVIVAMRQDETTAPDQAGLQAVLDSIQFQS